MARRCPDATDPRPATLADHDWLINERGVATVEPFDGVAGARRGVAARRPRPRHAGQRRGRPGAVSPRPAHRAHRRGHRRRRGSTSTIASTPGRRGRATWSASSTARGTTACRTAGSSSCGAGIRRSWPVPKDNSSAGAPQSLSELARRSRGASRRARCGRGSAFMAIHGGGLEQMTDVIAERAADAAGASVYLLRHPEDYPHHLPSALYRAEESERLAEFLDHVDVAVSLHGYGRLGRSTQTAGRRAQPRARRARRRTRRRARATTSSPTSTRSRANCAACTPTTRSTASAAAARSSSCRRGCGASARAARHPTTTGCPRRRPR